MRHAFRFPKRHRLLKRPEFLELAKNNQKIQNRHFIVLCALREENGSRLGITVTKRVGNAVTRNRIKRHCREFFRQRALHFRLPVDINIIAKKEAAALSGTDVSASLQMLFDAHRGDVF